MKKKQVLPVVLAAALMPALLAGCGDGGSDNAANTNSNANGGSNAGTNAQPANDGGDQTDANKPSEPITLTFFDKNTGAAFDNPVAQEIMKRTGVKVEIQQPTGNPSEKLNLMLASNDLPDIILMDRGGDIVNKYIAAGAIIPLNDLIDKYGPDVQSQYGDILSKTRFKDGKNYYLSNWYGMDNDPVFGVQMRKDMLKELAPDKAEGGQPFTTDEFEQLLKDFKAKYPTIDGKPSIPLTLNAENMGAVLGTFKGMWGMKPYYEDGDSLKFDVKDPKYREMILYMNKLYREGLIEQDWAVNKSQTWEQKISNGIVFSTVSAYWDLGNANGALKKDGGADKQLFAYKVVAPGTDPSQTTFGPRSPLGWDAIAITKKNKHPEETMKFINYLASEEGQYLLMWGVEGQTWDLKDGKHTPKPDVLQALKDDWAGETKKTGIRTWTWFIKNGLGSDGTPYDVSRLNRGEIEQMASKNLLDSVYDTSPYDNLNPEGGTPVSLSYQKVQDIMKQSLTKIIISKSEQEANAGFDAMLAEMKAAGDESVEKAITDNYKTRMELWK
ncbi:putative aldouronate transport system substrate-binding protein [Paenibacillus sp. UNC496MF]|uniref:extracellular solute-binding protein n=1 Tax=Paenibacillus sp. UNC496MF TaxID=1502753 RepID=UPI0008EB4A75|nr:extracellular solute-binding protein [Paenibacillus sp. UNC496MF]SFI50948.1 putative aldouronate transport system substrate-binding protein [Paenibacillus sp. UNC496MF]